jgi:ABC-type multidrug transport system ATPase subunit
MPKSSNVLRAILRKDWALARRSKVAAFADLALPILATLILLITRGMVRPVRMPVPDYGNRGLSAAFYSPASLNLTQDDLNAYTLQGCADAADVSANLQSYLSARCPTAAGSCTRSLTVAGIGADPTANNVSLTLSTGFVNYWDVNLSLQAALDAPLRHLLPDAVRDAAQYQFLPFEYGVSSGIGYYNSGPIYLATFTALCAGLACVLSVLPTVATLVDEKRSRLREHLMVMGVPRGVYILGAFVWLLPRIIIAWVALCCVCAGVYTVPFTFGAAMALLLCMLIGACAAFSLASLVPAIVSRPGPAKAITFLLTAPGVTAPLILCLIGVDMDVITALGYAHPMAGVFFACMQLIGKIPATPGTPPPAALLAVAFVESVALFLLGWYLVAVYPGEYGVPREWNFPCSDLADWAAGLFQPGRSTHDEVPLIGELSSELKPSASAGAPATGEHCIDLRGLTKYYGAQRETPSVDGLTLGVHGGEVLALLGHNGAGKTTTLSMLVGMTPATRYQKATVLGLDLSTQMDAIRARISYCPQFDVLVDNLSAAGHLQFFGGLRGVDDKAYFAELIDALELPRGDQLAGTFSGGMKRRLSLACALASRPRVLFLDEPSSGLDPVSRRQLWALVRRQRELGCTVVVTTHFMEEAEALGDRVAIMKHGRLFCLGSLAELTHRYGSGYRLTLGKLAGHRSAFSAAGVLRAVEAAGVVGASVQRDAATECTLELPTSALPQFAGAIAALEGPAGAALGIDTLALACSTLEDIFLAINDDAFDDESNEKQQTAGKHDATGTHSRKAATVTAHKTLADGRSVAAAFDEAITGNSAAAFFFAHVGAVLRMRFQTATWAQWVARLVLPLILVAIGVGVSASLCAPATWSYTYYDQGASSQSETLPSPAQVVTAAWLTSEDGVDGYARQREIFARVYARVFPGSTVTWTTATPTEYTNGLLVTPGLSRAGMDFVVMTPEMPRPWNAADPTARFSPNMTLFLSYDMNNAIVTQLLQVAQWAMLWDSVPESVITATIGAISNVPPVPIVARGFVQTPVMTTTTTIATTTTTAAPTAEPASANSNNGAHTETYCTTQESFATYSIPLFILFLLATVFGVFMDIVVVADDMNRGTYDLLRLHGIAPSAYWLATVIFAAFSAVIIATCAIIAVVIPDSLQILRNADVVFALFFGIVAVWSVNFAIGVFVILLLPRGLPHKTYVSVTLFVVGLSFGAMASKADSPITWSSAFFGLTVFGVLLAEGSLSSAGDPRTHLARQASFLSIAAYALVMNALVVFSPQITAWFVRLRHRPATAGFSAARSAGVTDGEAPILGARDQAQLRADVAAEASAIEAAVANGDVTAQPLLAGVHLGREYHGGPCGGGAPTLAVRDVTVGLRGGECVGLLGPNGAGKSTTIRMLTREELPTAGAVHLTAAAGPAAHDSSLECADGIWYRAARLGVCTQHDSLVENLTAARTLELFLRVRLGSRYDAALWAPYVASVLEAVGLGAVVVAQAQRYSTFSGGMKRKLAVAVAMYTGCRIGVLDEPSTGMDPHARRALWRTIDAAVNEGTAAEADVATGVVVEIGDVQKPHPCPQEGGHAATHQPHQRAVLVTTHSMEEAQAVCTRIGIVAAGAVRCTGSVRTLQDRFDAGYTLAVEFVDENATPAAAASAPPVVITSVTPANGAIARAVAAMQAVGPHAPFPGGCRCVDASAGTHTFALGSLRGGAAGTLAGALATVEAQRAAWGIRHYSITQRAALDQIFLQVATSSDARATM